MYHKWEFKIKEEYWEEEKKKSVFAYYSDDEIEDMRKKYPNVKFNRSCE